jgi:hypothetical protein
VEGGVGAVPCALRVHPGSPHAPRRRDDREDRRRLPGKYKGEVVVKDAERSAASVTVPADAKPGDTVHLIAQVTDGGKPPLTRYARVISTVKPAAR